VLFYDRGDLVAPRFAPCCTTCPGIALIFLIQWIFLGNFRCALIVSGTIPVALLLAVISRCCAANPPTCVDRRHRSRHHRRRHCPWWNVFRHLAHHMRQDGNDVACGDVRHKMHRILMAAAVGKPIFFRS
jgi:hypothetical protein